MEFSKPSENLKLLAEFVMKIYVPAWFWSKSQSSCVFGPINFFKMIQFSRYLSPNHRKIVDDVLQRNAFWAHSENVLLAMLYDENKHIRELAYRKILASRQQNHGTLSVLRKFRVPLLNFQAQSYVHMLQWDLVERLEPPYYKEL